MLVSEDNIRSFNDLLDKAFATGEDGVRLFREVDRHDLADDLFDKLIIHHDGAMAQHGRLIAAARADDVLAFREHGLKLTRDMQAMQTAMAEFGEKLAIEKRRRFR